MSDAESVVSNLRFYLVFFAMIFCGCSSTVLVNNSHASKEMRAKNYKDYKEVLLLAPQEDKRNVIPKVAQELRDLGFKISIITSDTVIGGNQGSGFIISPEYVVTCAHVVGKNSEATLTIEGQRVFAQVVSIDEDADLALLKLASPLPGGAAVLTTRKANVDYGLGDEVLTVGFPLTSVLGNSARMSKGLVSATVGLRDDPKRIQISAEVQPGNSGGPLLDSNGVVIGVIQQTINPWSVAQASGGSLPQNINFALKTDQLLRFITASAPDLSTNMAPTNAKGLAGVVHGVVKVQEGHITVDEDRSSKMVVEVSYVSIWDVWYRFRLFILKAYDFDTGEALFAAGQGRDNLVSTEDKVIKDTVHQFKKAIVLH